MTLIIIALIEVAMINNPPNMLNTLKINMVANMAGVTASVRTIGAFCQYALQYSRY